MTIPLHTFEFEGADVYRYPQAPWKPLGITPAEWFNANLPTFLYSPSHVQREAVPLAHIEPPWASGLYFLLQDDLIQYVGKSSEIFRRIHEHAKKGWSFNRYWCFGGIPEIYIEAVEAFYIHALTPPLNDKYPLLHEQIRPLAASAKQGNLVYARS